MKFIKKLFSKTTTPPEPWIPQTPTDFIIHNITSDLEITRDNINAVHVLGHAMENPYDLYLVTTFDIKQCEPLEHKLKQDKRNAVILANDNTAYFIIDGKIFKGAGDQPQRITGINRQEIPPATSPQPIISSAASKSKAQIVINEATAQGQHIQANNTFVTTITGTGDKQKHKYRVYGGRSAHAGPQGRTFASIWAWIRGKPDPYKESRIPGIFANQNLMTTSQISRLAETPFKDFANYLDQQTRDQPAPVQPFKWLLAGHSRGGAIGNFLASPAEKTIRLNQTTTVKLEQLTTAQAGKSPLIRTVSITREKQTITVPVQIDRIGFTSTTGPNLKSDYQHRGANTNLEFLATRDAGPYGLGMKPQNQRRTINPGENLFVHIPVNHPVVTKAEPKRITHMQIIALTSYLQMRRLGYPINPDKYKIPLRKKPETQLVDIILNNGKALSRENCDLGECIRTLQTLQQSIKKESVYTKNPRFHVNGHAEDDRRFLVMRARVYSTALDERLALANHAIKNGKSESEALDQLFAGDASNELKEFQNFVQHCLAKDGLHDQHLDDPKNRDKFLLLKTAAILKDKDFTIALFKKIDDLFSGKKDGLIAVGIKNKILKSLESLPIEVDAAKAKKLLISELPERLKLTNASENQIAKLQHLKYFIATLENGDLHKLQSQHYKELTDFIEFHKGHPTADSTPIEQELEVIIQKFENGDLQESLRKHALSQIFPATTQAASVSSPEHFDDDNLIADIGTTDVPSDDKITPQQSPAMQPKPVTTTFPSEKPKTSTQTTSSGKNSEGEKSSLIKSYSTTMLGSSRQSSSKGSSVEKSLSTPNFAQTLHLTL